MLVCILIITYFLLSYIRSKNTTKIEHFSFKESLQTNKQHEEVYDYESLKLNKYIILQVGGKKV